jgi:hypothetical protein
MSGGVQQMTILSGHPTFSGSGVGVATTSTGTSTTLVTTAVATAVGPGWGAQALTTRLNSRATAINRYTDLFIFFFLLKFLD